MRKTTPERLRGEAAWRAHVKDIARSNEAASALAVRQRAAKDALATAEAATQARREMDALRDREGR
jgi:hypothetical protein